ncbi:MAG: ABC transporter ATP-binding protein, partial [Planctomycetota bacterium]
MKFAKRNAGRVDDDVDDDNSAFHRRLLVFMPEHDTARASVMSARESSTDHRVAESSPLVEKPELMSAAQNAGAESDGAPPGDGPDSVIAPKHGDRSSDGDLAISACELSKMYKLYRRPSHILKEILLRRPLHDEHWALRNVSFNVQKGEIVGIVGANGAGKSTLLRILSGVLDPTAGAYTVNGELRAILQLGTGFHPQYTGRENIYMSGYCLGYSREQIDASLEEIIDFSGVRHAIDRPVRTYSSGMLARLMFSVTFSRRPEILIVDEALATGDLAFNQKCTNRIVELCSGGSTALIVSHSMFFIERLCSRAIYLRDGQMVEDGPARRVTRRFEREL